jgi:hypothetical protein
MPIVRLILILAAERLGKSDAQLYPYVRFSDLDGSLQFHAGGRGDCTSATPSNNPDLQRTGLV